MTAFLFGCAGTEIQKEVVTNTKTQVVSIPDTLLEPCEVTSPPNRQLYKDTDDKGRLELLLGYSNDLLKDMAKCNNNVTEIRKLQEKQRSIYSTTSEHR